MEATWEGDPVHMTSHKRRLHSENLAIQQASCGQPGNKGCAASHGIPLAPSEKRRRCCFDETSARGGAVSDLCRTADSHAGRNAFALQVKAAMTLTGAARKDAMARAIMGFEALLTDLAASQQDASSGKKAIAVPQAFHRGRTVRAHKAFPEARFLSRLHALLKRMAPELRRQAISQQLTQSQRCRLQAWMQMHAAQEPSLSSVCNGSRPKGTSVRNSESRVDSATSTAGYLITRGQGGYRACVHLDHGLVVTTRTTMWTLEEATAALAKLVAWRVDWRCGANESISAAGDSYFFQAVVSVASVRFAAPLRQHCRIGALCEAASVLH